MEHQLYGGVELGGTKIICAIANKDGEIVAQNSFPTTSTEESFAAISNFFEHNLSIRSLGIGSFGPVQLDTSSPEYGYIYNSPKPGWSKINIKGLLEERLRIPVAIDTDVNCAALGEYHFGVARNAQNFIYLTLGTGIGGCLMNNGKPVHGILNLEMGHMRIPHEPFEETFKGACVFHGDCLEGIASGHAMAVRHGQKAEEITDSRIWNQEAKYIALAVNNLMMTHGPDLIVLGGGLTSHPDLIDAVRAEVPNLINEYLDFPALHNYIVQSSGTMNGVMGAIKLAALSD